MDMTNWTGNTDLVRAWINMSGELPEWLTDLGVEHTLMPTNLTLETMGRKIGAQGGFPKGYNIGDMCMLKAAGRGHGGALMIKKMVEAAEKLGVDVRLGTPAKKILKVGDRITGVYAEDRKGKMLHVDANAVVVATAGFNDDPEMIRKYGGYDFTLDRFGNCEEGDFFNLCLNTKYTGDGIKMAWEAGADKGSMGIGVFNHVPGPGIIGAVPWIMLSQVRIVQEQPYLWVNQRGERFMDEGMVIDHVSSGSMIARQKGKWAAVVFDEDTKRHMEEERLEYQYFIFPAKTLTDLKADMRNVMAKGNKHVFMADTLEDLARQMDIDPGALKQTVDTYNGFCDKGHDDQYAKEPRFLWPVKKPQFYGLRTYSTAYQTIGGIKVNGRKEALTDALDVVPGLYAAGDIIAAELFGDPPNLGLGHLSFALSSGRIAGQSVLKYLHKQEISAER